MNKSLASHGLLGNMGWSNDWTAFSPPSISNGKVHQTHSYCQGAIAIDAFFFGRVCDTFVTCAYLIWCEFELFFFFAERWFTWSISTQFSKNSVFIFYSLYLLSFIFPNNFKEFYFLVLTVFCLYLWKAHWNASVYEVRHINKLALPFVHS